jgi:Zn-dependent oligopeptidase
MDIIKKYVKLSEDQILNKLDQYILKSNEIKTKMYNLNIPDEQKIKLLIEDTFVANTLMSVITLMLIIETDINKLNKWDNAKNIMMEHNYSFNIDNKLKNKIIELYQNNTNLDNYQKIFLTKYLNSVNKFGCNDKIKELIKNMDNTEDIIYNSLQKAISIQINKSNIDAHTESIMSVVQPDSKNNIIVDRNKYYYLLKHIKHPNIRDNLENKFIKKYIEIIPNICRLLILRNIYAKSLNFRSYYHLLNNRTSEENDNIKQMINDINQKVDSKFRNMLLDIKSKVDYNRLLKCNDIIYVIHNLYPSVKFKPVEILQVIFLVMQRKFGLIFKKSKNNPINAYSNVLDIYDTSNNLKGYLHLDLLKRNKKISQITLLKLNSSYGTNVPSLYLLANYSNLDNCVASYYDVVTLFREFGIILNQIFAYTPIGINEDDLEMFNFTSELMEFFAYSPFVTQILLKDKNLIRRLELVRNYEIIINIKFKSIYILFDKIIHESDDLMNILKVTKDSDLHLVILGLYNRCFSDIFNNHKDLLDMNDKNININVVNNIINGTNCIQYSYFLNLILAYNTYELLENDKNLNLFKSFLENKDYSYKKLIIDFMSNLDTDYYENFLIQCLGLNELKVDNYYCENTTELITDHD